MSWDNIANTKLKFFRLLSESDRFLKNLILQGAVEGEREVPEACIGSVARGFAAALFSLQRGRVIGSVARSLAAALFSLQRGRGIGSVARSLAAALFS